MEKVKISHLDKSFFYLGKNLEVLQGISLEIRDGEFVSLLGPSGCGKSTVLDLISGKYRPDNGEIVFSGGERPKVSYMPQKDLLLPWRTVIDNACVPLEIQGVKKETARAEAQRWMELFGLAGFEAYYPAQLSGGMRQRAALLRTFLHQGEIWLLDEPFGKLDAITRNYLQQWLMEVWEEFRQSVLFVTHDVDEGIFLSDRIYLMTERPGRVKKEISIDLPRPRTKEMMLSPEFIGLKKKVLELL